jgi:hypothetical protein
VLQGHVILGLQTDAGTEDVGQSTALLGKSVDDRSSWRGQGSLKHVAEDAEDAVEVLEILGGNAIVGLSLPLDAGHDLGNEDEIDDQRRSQERVLADIEDPRHVRTGCGVNGGR